MNMSLNENLRILIVLIIILNTNYLFPQNGNCPKTVNYEGKTYNTVQIGSQCWLKENLDVGIIIQSNQKVNNNGKIEKYCYDDDPTNCFTYGGLYKWNEAMQYSSYQGARGICPPGWHLPTKLEFEVLTKFVNNESVQLLALGEGNGKNTSGFSAILSGYLGIYGDIHDINYNTLFWTSTEANDTFAYYISLQADKSYVNGTGFYKEGCFSVRCVQD